ncbi:MAG: hypothetical protein QM784_13005 [Polyangiaceae bacterium]
MRRLPVAILLLTFVGCLPQQAEQTRDSAQKLQELKTVLEQRDALFAKWSKAPQQSRESCELTAGDCKLQVSERREAFINAHGVAVCRNPDLDVEARCVADELLKRGTVGSAAEYFAADVWCWNQLLACLDASGARAKRDAEDANVAARRKSIEESAKGKVQRARVGLVPEKIKYVRATLPPDSESECGDIKPDEASRTAAERKRAEFEEELHKPEGKYDATRAAKLHDEATAKEGAVRLPELDCLLSRLPRFGETPETRKWLDRNFEVLEQRQQLVDQLGTPAAEQCQEEATKAHQAEIIRTYTAYVREPVLFFRMQLHRTFHTFHEAQLRCLKEWANDAQ